MNTEATSFLSPVGKDLTTNEEIWSHALIIPDLSRHSFCFVRDTSPVTHNLTVLIYACTDNSPFKIPDWDGTGANWQLLEMFTMTAATARQWKYYDHAYYAFRVSAFHNDDNESLPSLRYSSHHN